MLTAHSNFRRSGAHLESWSTGRSFAEFREQVQGVERDPQKFLTAYMLDGPCFAIPKMPKYSAFRHEVAEVLSPTSDLGCTILVEGVRVVGSGKLGYSLNPKQFFKPFDAANGSDLDVAIVSETLFEKSLEDLQAMKFHQELNRSLVGKPLSEAHFRQIYILRSILDGFVPLESVLTRMRYGQQWSKARDSLIQTLGSGYEDIEINFRLYKSSEHLRAYQLRSIERAITELDKRNAANGRI